MSSMLGIRREHSFRTLTQNAEFQLQMNQMQKNIEFLNREVKDLKKALSNQTNNEHSTSLFSVNKASDQYTSTLNSSTIIDVTKLSEISNMEGASEINLAVTSSNETVNGANDIQNETQDSNIYNTGGVYLHATLAICQYQLGAIKSWLAAIGAFTLTLSQLIILYMIWVDSVMTVDKKSEEDFCGSMQVQSIIVLIFMSIVFACIVYDDVRESIVEEKILNHFLSKRKQQISSMRAVELLRICLRLRQFILPWQLSVSAIWLILSGTKISTNEIILNFLSVGFVAEADNFMGRLLFMEGFNQKADEVIASIIKDLRNDNNDLNDDGDNKQKQYKNDVSTTSLFWPQVFAIFPATIITIASTFIERTSDCHDKLRFLLGEIAYLILPNIMILVNGIISFVRDRRSGISFFDGYMYFMEEWILNCSAWLLLVIVSVGTLLAVGMMEKKFTFLFPCFGAYLIGCVCLRDFYHNHVKSQGKTWRNVVFVTFSSVLFLIFYALAFFGLRN